MNVGDVVPILDRVEAELVGRPVGDAAADAAAGQPGAEAIRVMVAAVALRAGRAAELGAPDDQRVVAAGRAASGLSTGPPIGWSTWADSCRGCCLMPLCASQAPPPPPPWKTCTKRTPRSTSRRAARHSWPNGRVAGLVQAVELLRRRRLLLQLQRLGHGGLHAESQSRRT